MSGHGGGGGGGGGWEISQCITSWPQSTNTSGEGSGGEQLQHSH